MLQKRNLDVRLGVHKTKLWKESLHLASVEELCQRCRYTPTALLSFLFLLLAASETIFIAYFTLFWSSKQSFST